MLIMESKNYAEILLKMNNNHSEDKTTDKFEEKEDELSEPVRKKAKLDDQQLLPIRNKSSQSKSPKKRLNLKEDNEKKNKGKFIYGNYSKYYGYRNFNNNSFNDNRINILLKQREIFEGKELLDIGCNCGLITMEFAKNFSIQNITGIDIDSNLINRLCKYIRNLRRNYNGPKDKENKFPFNIEFVRGNYVLRDDVLLEIETETFDIILCLSVTKWIHLNFGDKGLKQSFKRMYKQLRPGGKLILEAQPWSSYSRRKKLTPEIFENYKGIKFPPKDFTNYLLGPEIGFSEVHELGVPSHNSKGFRRPIQIFSKSLSSTESAEEE